MRDHDKTVPHDWHAAFRDAIRLTFFPYLHVLSFEFEHPLNTEPLRIDAVIIKKEPGIIIDNPLGSMFRRINIVEYKSPNDYLSVYDYHKVCAYARLYFAVHHLAEGIEEMTVTLVGRRRPRKLLGHLRETCGYEVKERGSGIYEVKGEPYRVQVVVTEELEGEVEWLRELRGGLKAEELRVILEKADEMPAGSPVSAYKDRILQANEEAVKELRMSTRGFDKLMEEWGLAAKWEARGRKAAAAEYEEQIKQTQEQHRQTQEQIRRIQERNQRLEKEIRRLREGR